EGGGGGNSFESYNLPWYFAATRTKCDAFLKRQKKGYLFTVGDEPPPPVLRPEHIKQVLGERVQHELSSRDVLAMASKTWEVFHIMIEQGSYYRSSPGKTRAAWTKLMGQRAMPLSDHEKLAELIVSTIAVNEGEDLDRVAGSWSGGTGIVIRKSLGHLAKRLVPSGKGVTRL
ncbi:MAG: hypothetical protein K2Z81_08135, partial [Cyanobacteria bacterium]|nr:hypothetical protein [Cyanobacteriota bacterium]